MPVEQSFKRDISAPGFLLVDLQERLAPAIPHAVEVVFRCARLIEEVRQKDLPILATEQYSRGLGPTVAGLRGRLAPEEVIEKIHFAAPREPAFVAALHAHERNHWVVAGMEAHVCVQQTVLALLEAGFAVTVLGDAVASRVELNRRVALARMASAGANVTDAAAFSADLALSPAATPSTMAPPA